MEKKISVLGTGDSLFITKFPKEYDTEIKKMVDFIDSVDVKVTNLETNLSDFEYFPNQFSGGTWLNTKREYVKDLTRFNFDVYGTANNHAMDYGHQGLLSTLKTLDDNNLPHCGSGESLEKAETPVFVEKKGVKVGVLAVDCVLEAPAMAGKETKALKSRPGVNYLRKIKTFRVSCEELEQLKSIAKSSRINFNRDNLIATGFVTEETDGVFVFGDKRFTCDQNYPVTKCNKADLNRLINGVKSAKEKCDYLIMMVHCHDNDDIDHAHPAEYLREFSKACIDNGVDAIFGGGCHELRGIEIYKDRPIFYSLGDFIYQGMEVEILPADFLEKYGVDKNASAKEGLDARSKGGKIGLQTDVKNFLTVLPKIEFTGDKMTGFSLLPVELGFEDKVLNGLPMVAKEKDAKHIFDTLVRLSKDFGTKLKMENGYITIE